MPDPSSRVIVPCKCVVLAILSIATLLHAQDSGGAVPLDDPSKSTVAALTDMKASLSSIRPIEGVRPKMVKTKDGVAILYGDLFHSGRIHALVALSGNFKFDSSEPPPPADPITPIGLGFAEWKHSSWETRGLWRIFPVWRPKGWVKSESENYLRITPAEKPFWLKDLGDARALSVVVAGDVELYCQEYDVLAFDQKGDRLKKVAKSLEDPKLIHGWVRLQNRSCRLGEFEEWTFCQWENRNLSPKATWHEEVPRNNPDDEFLRVTRYEPKGGKREFILRDNTTDTSVITFHDRPFARVITEFHPLPRRAPVGTANDEIYIKEAYLFEKLTGLPRKLFPSMPQQVESREPLEKIATIHVAGERNAVRMLSP